MLPLARELLRRGTVVIIAANHLPAINDITAAELDALLPQASQEMHLLPGACMPVRVVQCVRRF
jgi:type II pantothenate kinase